MLRKKLQNQFLDNYDSRPKNPDIYVDTPLQDDVEIQEIHKLLFIMITYCIISKSSKK